MRLTYSLFLLLISCSGMVCGASLTGSVHDEATPLAEVEVVLVNAQTGVILKRVFSDKAGNFGFIVTRGSYDIGAFKAEYTSAWRKAISVEDADVSIRIELVPKAFSDDATSDDCE